MTTFPKVIIVEDEKEIAELVVHIVSSLKFEAIHFSDGLMAHDYLQKNEDENIGLIIVDRMLPSMNGLDICKSIRKLKPYQHTAFLMLTALGSAEQIIEGLENGADDYITKPFDINILKARIKSLIRRFNLEESAPKSKNIITHKNIKVDLDQCKVWIDQEKIDLTLSEYKILCCFLESPGKVLTRNQLVQYVQDGPIHVTDRTIDTHIFGLRKKLKGHSTLIETIRGIGYRVASDE